MLVQNLILNQTQKLGLPLRVRSTAAQLSWKLTPYFASKAQVLELGDYQRVELISHICIFLACKFEDIHGHLDQIVRDMENSDLERIMMLETEILEFLDFRFSFVNVYQCALAFKYMLEKYRQIKIDWESVVEGVNRALCVDTTGCQCGIQELSLSVFDCTEEEVDQIRAELNSKKEYKNIGLLRRESRRVRLTENDDIKSAVFHSQSK